MYHSRGILVLTSSLLLLLILLLTTILLCPCSFLLPPHGHFVVSFNREFLHKIFNDEDANSYVNIVYFTNDLKSDTYFALYAGLLASNFDYMKRPYRVIIHEELHSDSLMLNASLELLPFLPKFTIFCIIEAGPFGMKIQTFNFLATLFQLHNVVLLHANHEQPWIVGDKKHIDFTFDSIELLNEAYFKFPMVIRNYFFKPLSVSSYYLPVLAPFYGAIIGNITSFASSLIQSSKRQHFCDFVGRRLYILAANPSESEFIENNHIYEREKLFKMVEDPNHRINCTVHYKDKQQVSNLETVNYLNYEDYIRRLGNTVFSLCPAGNNPETFRIYEALEMGSIPILVRPKDVSKNFLSSSIMWSSYPGPILDNWDDLGPYLSSVTLLREQKEDEEIQEEGHLRPVPEEIGSRLDALQTLVLNWYQQFKTFEKVELAKRLDAVFDHVDNDYNECHHNNHHHLVEDDTENDDSNYSLRRNRWSARRKKYQLQPLDTVINESDSGIKDPNTADIGSITSSTIRTGSSYHDDSELAGVEAKVCVDGVNYYAVVAIGDRDDKGTGLSKSSISSISGISGSSSRRSINADKQLDALSGDKMSSDCGSSSCYRDNVDAELASLKVELNRIFKEKEALAEILIPSTIDQLVKGIEDKMHELLEIQMQLQPHSGS